MSRYFDLEKLKEMIEAKAETVLPEHKSALLYISNWFNHLPAADVELVRHGYWHEVIPNTDGRNGDYECSVCGEAVVVKYPNCPYCRALMDGKEKEE